ncbi:gluconate 2-dehydrogenase subunit 3 family protein [Ningiella sp. W23]|uniref:gluconate 2-dehydrogenase subunit 3 family protein n=1 Tax=Ningiella sp. W23 TaxID=3023715 RepID=UPI0037584B68
MNMTRRQALKSLALGSGVVLSSTSVLAVLNTAYANTADGAASFTFLSKAQAKSIALMTHVIIPKSADLPGAEDVPIVNFIDALYSQLMDDNQRKKFLRGLEVAEAAFADEHKQPFSDASIAKRESFVKSVYELPKDEAQSMIWLADKTEAPEGQEDQYYLYHFLYNLRVLTLEGYFESELVGEKVLAYLPVPGGWEPEMDVDENTRVWSIN